MRSRYLLVVVVAGLMLACTASAAAGHTGGVAGLTKLVGKPNSPVWSPDGKQIAFASLRGGPYRIVRRSSRPGGAVHTVLAAPDAKSGCCDQMRWVGAGRILVDASGRLKSVSVDGGKPKRVALGCHHPGACGGLMGFLLSPNHRIAAVVFCGCTGLNSAEETVLVRLPPGRVPVVLPTVYDGGIVAFSPDSKEVLFRYTSGLVADRISDGTQVPLAQSGIPGAARVPSDSDQVQWSSDGRWVAFVENRKLEVVSTAGTSDPRVLANSFGSGPDALDGFSWSPDSSLIAYTCCDSQGPQQLMTVRPDGTQLTDLLKGGGLTYVWRTGGMTLGPTLAPFPQWSPTRSRLLFLASHGAGSAVHVWSVRANGTGLNRLG